MSRSNAKQGHWRQGRVADAAEYDDDLDAERMPTGLSVQNASTGGGGGGGGGGALAQNAAMVECDPAVLAAARARIQRGFEDHVPFEDVVKFCEAVGKRGKHEQRRELIQRMFNAWKGDKYVLLRLLLPHLDKERQSYGIKESVLAHMYVRMLSISVTSEHARQLLQWKRPSSGRASGDFASIVEQALQSRLHPQSTLTVGELNRALDELARAVDRTKKKDVLGRLLMNSTARQQKWIVRIVLKELKLGVSEKTFLKSFHVDAEEYFNITSSLRKVCETLIDAQIRLPRHSGLALGLPIKPMLAGRANIDAIPTLMKSGQFGIELKYDGERIQVHKDGSSIRLFTRRANEYTEKYGTLIPMLQRHIKADVQNCIIDGELMVWDSIKGQLEPFGHLKTFAKYDQGRTGRDHVDDDRSDGDAVDGDEALMAGKQYCYVAFDFLFINGKPLCDLQLRHRRELLARSTSTTPHEFELSQLVEAHSKEEIIDALDTAIANREEGIMVKDLASIYVPNERAQKWIKVKPEYIDGVGDDFDLIILGGFYGTGKRSGVMSGFLVGCAVLEPEQEAALRRLTAVANGGGGGGDDGDGDDAPIMPASAAYPTLFYSCAKVATGYSIERLKELNRRLEQHWRAWDPKNPPKHLKLGVASDATMVPDRWIEPKYSSVLQIKAGQIAETNKYGAGYTLRFPRVTKIRYDKHWYECDTLAQFTQLARTHDGRYARRTVDIDLLATSLGGAGAGAGRKRKSAPADGSAVPAASRQRLLLPSAAAADVTAVKATSALFAGREFCVYAGDLKSPTKQDLERAIVANGGTVVQEPLASTYAVIAGHKRTVKIRNLITNGRWNIVLFPWVTESIRAGQMIEFEPSHMIYSNAAQLQRFMVDIDPYGDSYTRPTRVDELQRIFAKSDEFSHTVLSPADKRTIEESVWKAARPWQGMFRPFVFYIDLYVNVAYDANATVDEPPANIGALAARERVVRSDLDLIDKLARFYGARVVPILTQDTSHVIVDESDLARLPLIRSTVRTLMTMGDGRIAKQVVKADWVRECVSRHEALDEKSFVVLPQRK
jgi:DNA ligase-4